MHHGGNCMSSPYLLCPAHNFCRTLISYAPQLSPGGAFAVRVPPGASNSRQLRIDY